MESSGEVYAVLVSEMGPKGRKSLERVKAACDLIALARGVMNYSRVAKVATEHFGGPKAQSVQNSSHLKRYIDARVGEYTAQRHSRTGRGDGNDAKRQEKYPHAELDQRTKTYIDQLHSRLDLVESRYRDLRRWQEEFTRRNPVNLAAAIGCGPTSEGALQVQYDLGQAEFIEDVKAGIRRLLSLSEYIPSLQVETKGDSKRLTLKRPAGDYVVVEPRQYLAIQGFLGEAKDAFPSVGDRPALVAASVG